jgi:CRISPR/Cas system-associated exonuclease Cas4 (RecB family)
MGETVDIAAVAAQISDGLAELFSHDRPASRSRTNQFSQIGKPCERFLVLDRNEGGQKSPFPMGARLRMERGKKAEEWVKAALRAKHPTRVVELEREVEIRRGNLSGRIDIGWIVDPSNHRSPFLPVEVKSTAMFDQIETVADLLASPWTAPWVWQVTGYMLALNVEYALILLVEPSDYQWKVIPVALDYDLGERLLKRAEGIEAHLTAGTLPDYHPDPRQCKDCRLAHVCCPPMNFEATMAFFEGSELESDLQWLASRKADKSEFDKRDRKVKDSLKVLAEQRPGAEQIVIGETTVQVKRIEKRAYTVAAQSNVQFTW